MPDSSPHQEARETMRYLRGRAIADGDFFQHSEPEPGDYGRVQVTGYGWRWFVCLPNGVVGQLHHDHLVEENDDGTITVRPSILNRGIRLVGSPLTSGPPITDRHSEWHGYLIDGVWKEGSMTDSIPTSEPEASRTIWYCKIGETDPINVPQGGDSPMRRAIEKAYHEITGEWPEFIFSGWGAQLTEAEREVADMSITPQQTEGPKLTDSPFPQPALESSEKSLFRDREIPGKPADYEAQNTDRRNQND